MGKPQNSSRECSRGCSPKPGCSGECSPGCHGDINEGKQEEKHLREHSPEHPDFGEHPREHSQELFWGFPFLTSLPGQEIPYPRPRLNSQLQRATKVSKQPQLQFLKTQFLKAQTCMVFLPCNRRPGLVCLLHILQSLQFRGPRANPEARNGDRNGRKKWARRMGKMARKSILRAIFSPFCR